MAMFLKSHSRLKMLWDEGFLCGMGLMCFI